MCHLRLSRDPGVSASDVVATGVAFIERDEVTLFEWIRVDSRLSAGEFEVGVR